MEIRITIQATQQKGETKDVIENHLNAIIWRLRNNPIKFHRLEKRQNGETTQYRRSLLYIGEGNEYLDIIPLIEEGF